MTNALLWSHFEPTWPTNGPGHIGGSFETIPAWGLPLVNTMLLLSSGVTITIAHHALRAGHRKALLFWLGATVVLGAAFRSEEHTSELKSLMRSSSAVFCLNKQKN